MTHTTCAVAAHGVTAARAAELPALRQRLAGAWAATLSAPLLRQADDQCVVALAAVRQARDERARREIRGSDWPVLAAPRFLGRAALAAALERQRLDGPRCVSPHRVTHPAAHTQSGLLSLALQSHGLNLGVGGGPGGESELFLTAATLLRADGAPGVWVVWSAWDTEPVPSPQGEVPPNAVCRAVALALTPDAVGHAGFRLRVVHGRPTSPDRLPGVTPERLGAALELATECIWTMEDGLLELRSPDAAEGTCR